MIRLFLYLYVRLLGVRWGNYCSKVINLRKRLELIMKIWYNIIMYKGFIIKAKCIKNK